jgi:uncharacterized protein with PQ loop repeat
VNSMASLVVNFAFMPQVYIVFHLNIAR